MGLTDWLYRSGLYNLALWGPAPSEITLRLPETWPGNAEAGTALIEANPSWTAENHSFRFLADLAALGNEQAVTAARAALTDWIERCDHIEPVAWSPEILGERLYAWVAHYDMLTAPPQIEVTRQAMLLSLTRQARHLYRIVRRAPAPARLGALRGLVTALAAIKDRRLATAKNWLAEEAKTRILPDGGHVSRNPEQQIRALMQLIDARDALSAASEEIPKPVLDAIDRAAPMVRFFRHGDGKLALFNGANEGDSEALDRVLMRAEASGRPPGRAPQVGYERLQAGRTVVVMDCGAPPPAPFDTDAHAAPLAFEMSHGKERIIVNCGAFHGKDAHWQMAMRASAAHSTLVVADTSAAEIDAEGHFVTKPKNVKSQRNEQDGNIWVGSSHDGYEANFGLKHERELYISADGDDLRGEDRLTGKGGRGFVIRFHLHPEVEVSRTGDGNALLRLPGGTAWRLKTAGAVLNLAESVYLGDGKVTRGQQIVLDGHVGSGGASVKWALRREAKKGEKDSE